MYLIEIQQPIQQFNCSSCQEIFHVRGKKKKEILLLGLIFFVVAFGFF